MYTKHIQALFFVMRKKKENQIYEKNCTHIHTNIRTYIEKTTLHCTALHTYRNIYTYTHKVCHGILFVIFAYARCK